jgi:NADH dehydrogenase
VLPLAAADARFAPVFVDDVAEAFALALREPSTHGKTYELCGPEILSLLEIVRFVRAQLGLHRAIVKLPAALAELEAWIGEYLLPGKPFSRDNLASLSVASLCATDGFQQLGLRPRSMFSLTSELLGGDAKHRRLARLRQRARRG